LAVELTVVNLRNLLAQGEGQTIEFKKSFSEEVIESIGALANAQGGYVLIGVEDKGTLSGVSIGKKTLEGWANSIQDATDPRIQPAITIIEDKTKKVVAIKVQSSTGFPVSVKGRYLKRVGRTNQRMSHEEIMQRLLTSTGSSWDADVEAGASLETLDQDQITLFIETLRKVGRRPLPKQASQKTILEKLNLLQNGIPTRAAILLLGKNPTRYFPSAYLKLGRFRSPTLIVDDKRVDSNILDQLDEAMGWFRERFQTEFVISGKPQRDVIWEYPLDAVREALVNAVCHRDYRMNINIQVRLYDDRLEIWNPGGLPTPLTPADLIQEHDSIPRNTLLAECLFYCGLIESWGSGTTRMANLLVDAGLELPEFYTANSDRLRVIFYKDRFSEAHLLRFGLSERQISAVQHVRNTGRITNRQYQDLLDISERTSTRELNHLVTLGILSRHGSTGKGTYYSLDEHARKNRQVVPEKQSFEQRRHKDAKGATKTPQRRQRRKSDSS